MSIGPALTFTYPHVMHHILFIGEGTLYHHALLAVLQKELQELNVTISLADHPTNGCLNSNNDHSKLLLLFELQPNNMSSLESIRKICSQYPDALRMVILENVSNSNLKWCNSFGIKGYLQKHSGLDEFINAVKQMLNDGWYCSSHILKTLTAGNTFNLSKNSLILTQREMEILKLICEALNSEQIARQLFLSKRTVEWHRTNLLSKTGCKNSAGLVAYAWQLQNTTLREFQSR